MCAGSHMGWDVRCVCAGSHRIGVRCVRAGSHMGWDVRCVCALGLIWDGV